MRAAAVLFVAGLFACTAGDATDSPVDDCDKCDVDAADAAPADACAAHPITFPAAWIGGADCASEATVQVHQADADTYILRQSVCTHYEAPFVYLLFGQDKALLEDTGTGDVDLYAVVSQLVATRAQETGRSIELVVMNSHAHGDHVGGNDQFTGKPGVTVVGASRSDLADYLGLSQWPGGRAELDLGGRIVDVIAIPGHENAHIALYDRRDGLLLTGDTLYPGRLYIATFADYLASIELLVAHADANPVCHVLGTHIEMTSTPGQDYPSGADAHPNEHLLQLTAAHMRELRDSLVTMSAAPFRETHDHFIIYPL